MKKLIMYVLSFVFILFLSPMTFANETVVSRPMTASEIISQYAEDKDISLTQASLELDIDPYERATTTYRTISDTFVVTNAYRPAVTFYCQTSENGSYHGILKVLSSNINRKANGFSKQFAGNIYVNLERSDTLFYIVNGDFYNIGFGELTNARSGIFHTNHHYQYVYTEKRVHF